MTAADTILVVDDNDSVRALLRGGLEQQGWRVLLSASGVGVPELIAEHDPSHGIAAVLLDIVMAEREGIETLMELKVTYPELPVVMISSFSDYLPMARTLGADAALEKPLDLREVAAVLAELVPAGPPD
ncbi:response regulator [Pseudohaliea rubra]|uniref:Nitrogen regulation protein NtrX n=1 Tax=Pseudohaliea rubra DSM 19751 TaxID=1265313 RepID=A0A095XU45_9GAMM|nr:response regulator [Pseudohaliea rubra]KGE03186.1 Nitrogen regulation protein NtrX [Pseudohaliea rubra DSM 19751]